MDYLEQRREKFFYDVTAALKPGESAYAPELYAPPKEWFYEKPEWWGDVAQHSMTVDEHGRAAGLIANFDVCYLNNVQGCITPWPVKEDEHFVYQGNVAASLGEKIPVAVIAATKGHNFDDNIMNVARANSGFLDDKFQPLSNSDDVMAHQLLYGRYTNTDQGIAFLGAVFPHVSAAMVHRINVSAISPHWVHDVKTNEMIFTGAVFVNRGALPLHQDPDFELRNIAASLNYNHIMAGPVEETSCSCKDKHVAAATDPNLQNATGEPEALKPEVTFDDLVYVQGVHSQELAVLNRTVIELTRRLDKQEEAKTDG
jgi:hypothetical protein